MVEENKKGKQKIARLSADFIRWDTYVNARRNASN